MNKTVSIIASVVLAFALFFAYTNSNPIFAQNQTSSSSSSNKTSGQNQTSATVTGKAQMETLNKTSIPAKQTTVKVNTTTKPGQSLLKPLSNQTLQQVPSLSGIKNKTTVQATGPASTTIINKTTVPYNQTIIGTGNTSKSIAQSSSQNSSKAASGQNQSSSQNSSKAVSSNQTKSNAGGAAAAMNKTSQGASNATQGAGAALNQTGKSLSNVGNNVMQGIKNLFGGGGGKNSGQK